MSLLRAENITMKFGGLVANSDVSISVNKGEIVGLIGPNGAGKSTFFSILAGSLKPTAGRVFFKDKDITSLPEHRRSTTGIARTFQIVKPFHDMTVRENVMVGAFQKYPKFAEAKEKAEEVMEFTGLYPKRNLLGGNLTIAYKKRLEMARALATEPEIFLLDEAMAGLTQTEVKEAVELVKKINDQGVTLLVVEHVMEVVMPISKHVIVLDQGKKIAEGPPREIINNEQVIKAYLGDKYHAAN